jgi:hypothetical protein
MLRLRIGHSEPSGRTCLPFVPLLRDARSRSRRIPLSRSKALLLIGFVLSLLPLAAVALGAQDSGESLPKVISHDDAVYPAIARTAHIMGDVVVRITTDGESVREAKAESGPPLLLKAADDNAKTWKFAPHTPGAFDVTYHYDLLPSGNAVVGTSFPDSSGKVEVKVVMPPSQLIVDPVAVRLGTWKAEWTSLHGRLFRTLEFSYSGPDDDESLGVEIVGVPDDDADDYYGHKDGDFLAFSMKLAEPDGKRLKTYLVGKMTGNKIVGTFVDESGVRGTWTATLIPDSEKK